MNYITHNNSISGMQHGLEREGFKVLKIKSGAFYICKIIPRIIATRIEDNLPEFEAMSFSEMESLRLCIDHVNKLLRKEIEEDASKKLIKLKKKFEEFESKTDRNTESGAKLSSLFYLLIAQKSKVQVTLDPETLVLSFESNNKIACLDIKYIELQARYLFEEVVDQLYVLLPLIIEDIDNSETSGTVKDDTLDKVKQKSPVAKELDKFKERDEKIPNHPYSLKDPDGTESRYGMDRINVNKIT